jgi:hypothetical protein
LQRPEIRNDNPNIAPAPFAPTAEAAAAQTFHEDQYITADQPIVAPMVADTYWDALATTPDRDAAPLSHLRRAVIPHPQTADQPRHPPTPRPSQQTGASSPGAVAVVDAAQGLHDRQLATRTSMDQEGRTSPAASLPAGARLDELSEDGLNPHSNSDVAEATIGASCSGGTQDALVGSDVISAAHSAVAANPAALLFGESMARGPMSEGPRPIGLDPAALAAPSALDETAAASYRSVGWTRLDSAPAIAQGLVPVTSPPGLGVPAEMAARSSATLSALPQPGLAEQLTHYVIRSVDSGSQEIVLQLHPPELGELTLRVLVRGREVSAWFGSPQIPVQTAITQAIGQLHADLGNAGYDLTGAWVGADASGARDRDDRSLGGAQPRGAANRTSAAEPRSAASPSAAPGVSIYV